MLLPLPEPRPSIGPIRASFLAPTLATGPLLLWVSQGRAAIRIDSTVHDLRAGQMLRVPAGVRYSISTEPGCIAFPIGVEAGGRAIETMRWQIPAGWEKRLVYEFALNLSYLKEPVTAPLELVPDASSVPDAATGLLPPPPRSGDAFRIALVLLRDPGDPRTARELAAAAGIGERTLQRRFTQETGLSFAKWRTRVRLSTAADLLRDGHEIGWVAHQVGFAGASALARAFRTHLGTTPGRYKEHFATLTGRIEPGGALPAVPPPGIPASETWPHVNAAHVAVWVYRGTAEVDVAGRTWHLRRGDAILLPAGLPNTVRVAPDSLLLPLGFRSTQAITLSSADLRPVFFPVEDEGWLLHALISTYTALRPPGHDRSAAFDLVVARTLGQGAQAGERDVSPAVRLAAALSREPANETRLADWARSFGLAPRELHQCFRAETGMSLQQWRTLARMTHARAQLDFGLPPTAVGRSVGYAHPPAFTRAFRTAHGLTPQQYLGSREPEREPESWRPAPPPDHHCREA